MTARISPLKAIRKYCLNCMETSNDVKACPTIDCSLWKFRLGQHPFTEKGLKNTFLEPKFYEGCDDMSSTEIISKIKVINDDSRPIETLQ